MPLALEQTTEIPALPHKLWTREEVALLETLGLPDLERYELLEGELVLKMSKSFPHMKALAALLKWLRREFGEDPVVSEGTVDLGAASLPEPDVTVLRCSLFDLKAHPAPEDILLVAEVARTTLHSDLSLKARIYARAGIAEYWVIDLNARRLICHRDPQGDRYLAIAAYAEDEALAPLAAPASTLRVGALFA